MKQIDPAHGADLADVNFALEPGGEVEIVMVDPAGQPIEGVNVQGKTPHGGTPPVSTSTFAATGFRPNEERTILLRHWKRGLGKAILVRLEDQRKKITVRLEPFAKVTGRLVDRDQKPVTGHNIVFYTRPRMGIPLANEITDAQGRFEMKIATGLSFTAMVQGIPGNPTIINEMSAEPGGTIDLGTIDPASDKRPEPVRTKAVVAEAAAPNADPTAAPDDDRITIPGRVLDPAGKPVEGATVRLVRWYWDPEVDRKPLAETRSDKAGHFEITYRKSQLDIDIRRQENWKFISVAAFKAGYGPAWIKWQEIPQGRQAELRLAEDGLPITGRLIDLEGRPLAGVNIECEMLTMPIGADLSPWIEAVKSGKSRQTADTHIVFPVPIEGAGLATRIISDADGRFRLTGIGRERMTRLVFSGPAVACTSATVLTRAMPPLSINRSNLPASGAKQPVLGADFELPLPPTRVIEGIVRDAKTSQPIAGAGVRSSKFSGTSTVGERLLRTKSDDKGHFRLVGLLKGPANKIIVVPGDEQPYLMREATVPDTPGLEPAHVDVELHRGVVITGRVTDALTGEPVPMARLLYLPFLSNEYARALPEFEGGHVHPRYNSRYQTAADGSYRLVGLPGRAIVGVVEPGGKVHVQGQGASEIEGMDPKGEFLTVRNPFPARKDWPTAMKEINPADESQSVELDFALASGEQVEIATLDPAGQPISGVMVTGMSSDRSRQPASASQLRCYLLRPGRRANDPPQPREAGPGQSRSGARRG